MEQQIEEEEQREKLEHEEKVEKWNRRGFLGQLFHKYPTGKWNWQIRTLIPGGLEVIEHTFIEPYNLLEGEKNYDEEPPKPTQDTSIINQGLDEAN